MFHSWSQSLRSDREVELQYHIFCVITFFSSRPICLHGEGGVYWFSMFRLPFSGHEPKVQPCTLFAYVTLPCSVSAIFLSRSYER